MQQDLLLSASLDGLHAVGLGSNQGCAKRVGQIAFAELAMWCGLQLATEGGELHAGLRKEGRRSKQEEREKVWEGENCKMAGNAYEHKSIEAMKTKAKWERPRDCNEYIVSKLQDM